MKTAPIFVLAVLSLGAFLTVDSSPCEQQTYESGDPQNIFERYNNELGLFNYLKNIFTWNNSAFDISLEEKRKLCACVFNKMNPNANAFNNDVIAKTGASDEEFWLQYKYGCLPWFGHKTPYLLCTSEKKEKIAIMKGFTRKSAGVYDIYVSSYNLLKPQTFKGIVKNVDVKATSQKKSRG